MTPRAGGATAGRRRCLPAMVPVSHRSRALRARAWRVLLLGAAVGVGVLGAVALGCEALRHPAASTLRPLTVPRAVAPAPVRASSPVAPPCRIDTSCGNLRPAERAAAEEERRQGCRPQRGPCPPDNPLC